MSQASYEHGERARTMHNNGGDLTYRTTILGAIVAVLILAVAAIVALSIVGLDARSTPAIATIVGLIAPTLVALLALLKSEHTEKVTTGHTSELQELTRKVNGE